MLRLLEEVEVTVTNVNLEEQVAALERLRHLSHLRRLKLTCNRVPEAALPPIIPHSLKALHFSAPDMSIWLCELPSMLQASEATLEEIGVHTGVLSAEGGAALVQVLRSCSPALKTVKLKDARGTLRPASIQALLPGLVSCCDTLEVLTCPWAVFSALPATCPTFTRLATLHVQGAYPRDIDLASPAWDMMANGRLPALARLTIETQRDFVLGEGVEDGGGRLACAFEGVAGTLRRLTLLRDSNVMNAGLPAGAAHELGAAIGKLRRLRYLHLQLKHGGDCAAVGRGMAASGGCPELFEVQVSDFQGYLDFELLTYEPSLIVPSVRSLNLVGGACNAEEQLLLLCCGLVQLGYKHRLRVQAVLHCYDGNRPVGEIPASLLACLRAILCGGGMNADLSLGV
jgi:hypothetical protein